MSHSYSNNHVHVVYSTTNRQDLIPAAGSAVRPSRFDNVIRAAAMRGMVPSALLWKAVAGGIIRLRRIGVSAFVRFDGAPEGCLGTVGSAGCREARRRLRDLHESVGGAQPSEPE